MCAAHHTHIPHVEFPEEFGSDIEAPRYTRGELRQQCVEPCKSFIPCYLFALSEAHVSLKLCACFVANTPTCVRSQRLNSHPQAGCVCVCVCFVGHPFWSWVGKEKGTPPFWGHTFGSSCGPFFEEASEMAWPSDVTVSCFVAGDPVGFGSKRKPKGKGGFHFGELQFPL